MSELRDDDVTGWERRLREAEAFDTPQLRAATPYLNYRVGLAHSRPELRR